MNNLEILITLHLLAIILNIPYIHGFLKAYFKAYFKAIFKISKEAYEVNKNKVRNKRNNS